MAAIPAKVKERLTVGLKHFQPVLESAKARDVNESDTVTIVNDMLAVIFGFDKYSEITSEYAIRGTYVDLAVKLDGGVQMLIEVKAIGLDLKESFVKQAVDYAANLGVEWVILTNGVFWKVFKVSFGKPISQELILEIDILALNFKKAENFEGLYLLTRECMGKSMLGDYYAQRQALSRFYLGSMLLGDSVIDVLRRELRKISPNVKVDNAQIRDVLIQEVIKREVIEGEKADEAKRKIARSASKPAKNVTGKPGSEKTAGADAEPIVQFLPDGADRKDDIDGGEKD